LKDSLLGLSSKSSQGIVDSCDLVNMGRETLKGDSVKGSGGVLLHGNQNVNSGFGLKGFLEGKRDFAG
jgi:hypothetical protein